MINAYRFDFLWGNKLSWVSSNFSFLFLSSHCVDLSVCLYFSFILSGFVGREQEEAQNLRSKIVLGTWVLFWESAASLQLCFWVLSICVHLGCVVHVILDLILQVRGKKVAFLLFFFFLYMHIYQNFLKFFDIISVIMRLLSGFIFVPFFQ